MTETASVGLSVIIPIYNGAAIVEELARRLAPILKDTGESHELVLIDDGSTDASWDAITQAAAAWSFVRGFKLSRNFGQQIAVSAGIAKARGRYLIVMDGDLQNPPEAVPGILARLRGGDDIVYTVSRVRNNRRNQFTSQLFWFVLTRLLGVDIIRDQLMMRGMSRRFARIYDSYPEITRTVAGLSRDIGLRHSILEVENRPRSSGRSGYTFFKRFNLMINMIISITTAPLSILIYVSLSVLIITTLVSTYYLIIALFFNAQAGFTSIILSIFFFGSLITLILGIIGMYLANIYTEVRRRPLFLVEEQTDSHG